MSSGRNNTYGISPAEDTRTVRAHALRYVLDCFHGKKRAAGAGTPDGGNDAKVKEDRADDFIISK